MSLIWKIGLYERQDDGFAWCKICKKPLKLSDRSPSNLFSHVNQHPEYEKNWRNYKKKRKRIPCISLSKFKVQVGFCFNNEKNYPLAKSARRYLTSPATSLASESLISGARDVYDYKRSSLSPKKCRNVDIFE